MVVLDDMCEICNNLCYAIHYQRNFDRWTSGNNDIDKFIQDTQLSVHDSASKALEWIPYGRLYNIGKYITRNSVYHANWIDGCIQEWDCKSKNWKRGDQNIFVILKSLNDSE